MSTLTSKFSCTKCQRTFKLNCHLANHQKRCGKDEKKLTCELCGKYETTKPCNMRKHRLVCFKRATDGLFGDDADRNVNQGASCSNSSRVPVASSSKSAFTCDICRRPHGNMTELIAHRNVHSSVPTGIPTALSNDFSSIQLAKHAFGGHILEYDLKSHESCSDVEPFFQMSADLIRNLISSLLPTYVLQGRMVSRTRYFRLNDQGQRIEELFFYFPSLPSSLVDGDGERWYDSHSRRIIEQIETMNRNSSNIEFDSIERVYVKLILRDNVNGQGVFALPPLLGNKRQAIVNVNTPSECFKYALLSVLHYNDVPNRQRQNKDSYREWVGELNFDGIDVDNVSINDIHRIERLNNLKINVHVWEGASTLTVRYNSRESTAPKTVNVLLVSYQGVQHYCGIVSLKRLYYRRDKSHMANDFL